VITIPKHKKSSQTERTLIVRRKEDDVSNRRHARRLGRDPSAIGGRTERITAEESSRAAGGLYRASGAGVAFVVRIREIILDKHGNNIFANLHRLAIVTASFGSERAALSHLRTVVNEARKWGFKGQLYTTTSEIVTPEGMAEMRQLGFESYNYSLETFTRREELMPVKGRTTLDEVLKILTRAGNIFDDVRAYYLAGFDQLESIRSGAEKVRGICTIQPSIFVPYTTEQDDLYCMDAKRQGLTYFVEARKIIEELDSFKTEARANRRLL